MTTSPILAFDHFAPTVIRVLLNIESSKQPIATLITLSILRDLINNPDNPDTEEIADFFRTFATSDDEYEYLLELPYTK